VSYPRPERVLRSSERDRHAPDRADRGVVRPAIAACRAHPRSFRASRAEEHRQLVVCVRKRRLVVFLLQLATGIMLALIYVRPQARRGTVCKI